MTNLALALFRRKRHLSAWLDRIEKRVSLHDHQATQQGAADAAGVNHVALVARAMIKSVRAKLDSSAGYLPIAESAVGLRADEAAIDRESLQDVWLLKLGPAERTLQTLESDVVPLIAPRRESDARTERFVNRMLDQLGLSSVRAVCRHLIPLNSAARVTTLDSVVDPSDRFSAFSKFLNENSQPYRAQCTAVFDFFPSIRSFTALTLLYHEFGHVAFRHTLDAARRNEARIAITRAFPQPARLKDGNERRLREIFADVFAGLTCGYAYVATLASVLLCKRTAWTHVDSHYPSPPVRIRAALAGAEFAQSISARPHDSFLMGWSELEQLLEQKTSGVRHIVDPVIDTEVPLVIAELGRLLRNLGIGSAGTTPLFERDPQSGTPILVETHTPREIIQIATLFRAECRSASHYITWERACFQLPWIKLST